MVKKYAKPIKSNMPNTDLEDYHFPRKEHPSKLTDKKWLNLFQVKLGKDR